MSERVNPQTLLPGLSPYLADNIAYLFFPHNWQNGYSERLEWLTEIIAATDGSEQRLRLRTMPRRSCELNLLVSGKGRRMLESWLGLRRARYMLLPVWQDAEKLSTPILAESNVVTLAPQYLDYAVGRLLAVWDAWDHYEIRAVTGVFADHLTVDAPFTDNWPGPAMVAPLRFGLCPGQRDIARFTEAVADYALTIELLHEAEPGTIADVDTYGGLAVCPLVPSWVGPAESWQNNWQRLDEHAGAIEYQIQSTEPEMTRSIEFLLIGRDKIATMVDFLAGRCGRLTPFYLSADDRGIELALSANAGATELRIEAMGYARELADSPARSVLQLETTTGAIIRRTVLSVVDMEDGTEKLTLDSPLPVPVSAANLNRAAWLEKVRLDSDEITFSWISGECLTLSLPVRVLP